MSEMDAIDRALKLYSGRIPARSAVRQPFPNGMLTAIKVVAGDAEALRSAKAFHGEDDSRIKEACTCFVELVVGRPGASDLEVLGLNPGAQADSINEHKRALLKWLHPDRNQSAWQSACFKRVADAARRLQNASPKEKVNPAGLAGASRESRRAASARAARRIWAVSDKRIRRFESRLFYKRVVEGGLLLLIASAALYSGTYYLADRLSAPRPQTLVNTR